MVLVLSDGTRQRAMREWKGRIEPGPMDGRLTCEDCAGLTTSLAMREVRQNRDTQVAIADKANNDPGGQLASGCSTAAVGSVCLLACTTQLSTLYLNIRISDAVTGPLCYNHYSIIRIVLPKCSLLPTGQVLMLQQYSKHH